MCYLKFENFLTKAEDRNNYDDVKVSMWLGLAILCERAEMN